MNNTIRASILCSALTSAACDSPAREVTVPEPRAERLSGNVIHSLTGGGKVDVSSFSPDLRPELYAFSARLSAEGTAAGHVEMHLSDPAVRLHADVTCLAISGSAAWVGGVINRTSDPQAVASGTQFWARVDDGGEGSKAIDRISFVRLGPPASICNQMRPVTMPFVFQGGNVQVR